MSAHEQTELPFRRLTCRRCDKAVDVLELPDPYLDPLDYLCGDCAGPVADGSVPVPYNLLPPGL